MKKGLFNSALRIAGFQTTRLFTDLRTFVKLCSARPPRRATVELMTHPGSVPPDDEEILLDLNRFAAALIGRVLSAYDQFLEGGYRDKFAALWKRYDVLRGRPVSVTQGTRTVTGTATGIDDEGSLIVRLTSGRTERFRAGEVTLSRETAPAA